MQLGMIGLGRMGANMTERLVRGGHRVVGFDFNPEARQRVEEHGAMGRSSIWDKLERSYVIGRNINRAYLEIERDSFNE